MLLTDSISSVCFSLCSPANSVFTVMSTQVFMGAVKQIALLLRPVGMLNLKEKKSSGFSLPCLLLDYFVSLV